MMCDLPKNRTNHEIDTMVNDYIMNHIAKESGDIVSIIHIMDTTSLENDQKSLLQLKVEVANHKINDGPIDEIDRLEKETINKQDELNAKIKL
jgi:hypothetical protein